MSVGTRLDSSRGPVVSNNSSGTSIEKNTSNVGFAPFKVDSVTAFSSATTLVAGNAGVSTISGSGGAVTLVMPLASACPGAMFTFRSLSPHAHALTGSQEAQGVQVFTNFAPPAFGSKLTLSGAVGASVTLISTGVNFMVLGFVTGSANSTNAVTVNGA